MTEATREQLAEALAKIEALAAPGQELGISDAIDLICDIYTVARLARVPALHDELVGRA